MRVAGRRSRAGLTEERARAAHGDDITIPLGEVSKRAAGSFFTPKLFSERTKRLVRLLSSFG